MAAFGGPTIPTIQFEPYHPSMKSISSAYEWGPHTPTITCVSQSSAGLTTSGWVIAWVQTLILPTLCTSYELVLHSLHPAEMINIFWMHYTTHLSLVFHINKLRRGMRRLLSVEWNYIRQMADNHHNMSANPEAEANKKSASNEVEKHPRPRAQAIWTYSYFTPHILISYLQLKRNCKRGWKILFS